VTGEPESAGDLPADSTPRVAVRAWRGFRDWVRVRPFWGGLFLIMSGIEFYLSGHLDVLPVKLSFGGQSFLAWLIPIALILCGLLTWYTPGQRAFYGILGAAISVAALIGLNLGGFFLGMIFGIVGGALAFSWTPDAPAAFDPMDAGEPQEGAEPPDPPAGGRHVATLILFVVLAIGGTVLLGPPVPASAAPCKASTSVTASPSAHPSSGAPAGNPVLGFFEQLGKLLGIGGSGPQPSPSPSPSASPTPSASCAPSASPSGPSPSSGSKAPSGSPSKAPKAKAGVVPAGQPPVNDVPSTQITALLSQAGLSFDGVVDLPTHSGTIRVLRFTLSSSSSTPFELRVPTQHGTISLRSSKLTVSGQVQFYTTQIKGNLFGLVPVNFTPDSPPPLTVPDLFFTDATVQLVFVHAGTLTAPALHIAYL